MFTINVREESIIHSILKITRYDGLLEEGKMFEGQSAKKRKKNIMSSAKSIY